MTTRALYPLTLFLLAVATGCGPAITGQDPVRLGAIYPLSGPEAPGGREEWQGVRLAADMINAEGGWRHHRVEFAVRDSPSPEAAAEAARSLVVGERIPIVLGAHGSSIAAEAARMVLSRGAIYWETGAVATDLPGWNDPHFFRTGVDGGTLGAGSARFAAEILAPRLEISPADMKVAAVYVDDVYGRSVAEGAVAEARHRGLPVVGNIGYDPHAADYPALVAAVERARPDVLFVASYLQDGVAFRRAALSHRLPLRAMIGTSSAFCLPAFGQILGQDAVGLYASDKPGEEINRRALSPVAARLLDRVRHIYSQRHGSAPGPAALAGFVSAWVLLHDVLPAVDRLDPDQVAEAARRLDMPEGSQITGAGVRFAPPGSPDAGQNRRPASIIWEWQAPRRIVPVFPPAYALHEPIVLPIDG